MACCGPYGSISTSCTLPMFPASTESSGRPPSCTGFRMARVRMLTAQAYREILATAPSPQSLGAPREEEVLFLDITSPTQALVKVRVRISALIYVDYLSYHRVDGEWLVSAKAFHVESNLAAAA